jgi:hypothetical protein
MPDAAMDICSQIQSLIVRLRRRQDPHEAWREFQALVENNIGEVCRALNTRQLVSVCDTYADFGDPIEGRNALMVTLLANLEKTSQSFLFWRLNYEAPFDVPPSHQPRKVPLWDGMDSFHLEIGDVTNSFFSRLDRLMRMTPHIERIYRTVTERMKNQPTILGALNKVHQHVFESTTRWRKAPKYDHYRASGSIPAWKTDDD